MLVRAAQRKSLHKTSCEDRFVSAYQTHTFGVFDGVTPIVPFQNDKGENGAIIASSLFARQLEETASSHTLRDILLQANQTLRNVMRGHNIPSYMPHHRFATCAAIARIEGNSFAYAQLGDSMVAVKTKKEGWKLLTSNTLDGLAERMKHRWMEETQESEEACDHFFSTTENRIPFMRRMANTPDGYTVADGGDISASIQTGRIPLSDIKAAILCTDGIFSKEHPLLEVCQTIEDIGLELFLYSLECDEANYNLPSDDKTVIWFEF